MAHPGPTIKRWMDSRGLSEGQLARISGVTQPTIHRILTQESKDPRRSNLERIAKAFGRDVDDLYDPKADPGDQPVDERAHQFALIMASLSDEQIEILFRTALEFQRTS